MAIMLVAAALFSSTPQDRTLEGYRYEPPPPKTVVEQGVFVSTGDIKNCPYRVVGSVSANMRMTLTYGGSDEGALRKLGRKAAKMDADAVILATIGPERTTAFAWSSRAVTGRVIRFVDKSCAPSH